MVTLDREFRRYHLFGRFWRPDWPRYRKLWKLGFPIGLAMGFEGGVFSAAAYLMGLIDAESVAAHAVALQIAALSFMVPWGLAQASTVRVGKFLGEGDRAGIARAGWTAWALGVGFMALMTLLIWAFPRDLMTIFLDDTPENARVIALGVSFLAIAAIFQVADGAQVVGAGMLREALMLADACDKMPATRSGLYVYVDDVDGTWQRAVDAGAESQMAPADQFYGDRSGGFKDQWDNSWYVAKHIEDVSPEEIARRAEEWKSKQQQTAEQG